MGSTATPGHINTQLLCLAKASSKVSVWQYIHGILNFATHSLASLGCTVQLYEYLRQQKTWGELLADGWYIVMVSKHYRSEKK